MKKPCCKVMVVIFLFSIFTTNMAYAIVEEKGNKDLDKPLQVMQNQSSQNIEIDDQEQIKEADFTNDKKRLIIKFSDQVNSTVECTVAKSTGSNPRQLPFMSKYKMTNIQPLNRNLTQWKSKNNRSESAYNDKIKSKYLKRTRRYKEDAVPPKISGTYIVETDVTSQNELEKLIESIKKEPGVVSVETDKTLSVQMTPNDPYYATNTDGSENLYNIKRTSTDKAWDLSMGEGITVAVIDSGVDTTHPDINDNIWVNPDEIPGNGIDDDGNNYIDDTMGWDFKSNDNDPTDDHGHGSHVAGIIAAEINNETGIVGVAPKAKIMAIKGVGKDGNGKESELAKAIIYAVDNGADILNLSFGGVGTSSIMEDAVNYAYSMGVVVVAAAGNESMDVKNFYPASINCTIAVAALDDSKDIKLANFSDYGNKIDVAAPGVKILSLRAKGTNLGEALDSDYTCLDGTSMAAPHVAGLAALILSKNPEFSNEDIRQVLHVTSTQTIKFNFSYILGYGMINSLKAVSQDKVLEAKMISPVYGRAYTGKIPVTGIAKGNGFSKYTLELGAGNDPSEWNIIGEGTAPVDKGLLGTVDATVIPDGTYLLRLRAYDDNHPDYIFEDRLEFDVDYVALSDPKPPKIPTYSKMIKPGTPLQISGKATGPSFVNYKLEWAAGLDPTDDSWSAAGFNLADNGINPINEGLLGTWDTSTFTDESGYCQIRLTVMNNGFSSISRTMVYLEKDLASSNWPIHLNHRLDLLDGCVLPAKGTNGNTSLIVNYPESTNLLLPSDDPKRKAPAGFRRFSFDGKEEFSATYPGGHINGAVVGELGGLQGDEVVTVKNSVVNIVRPDNTYEEVPLKEPDGVKTTFGESKIILEDVDGDGSNEIIAMGNGLNGAHGKKCLYVWKSDGSLLSDNFPLLFEKRSLYLSEYFLVVDINNDNKKEFLVTDGASTSNPTIKLINWDGTPGTLSFQPKNKQCAFRKMSACDLDKNGQMEIIFTTNDNMIYVLDSSLSVMPGWPVAGDTKFNLSGEINAIADMDRDGKDEIIYCTQKCINILRYDGTPMSDRWPYYDLYMGGLVVGDMNNDNYPDIVMTRNTMNNNYRIDPGLAGKENALSGNSQSGVSYYEMTFFHSPQIIAMDRNANIIKSWNIMTFDELRPHLGQRPVIGDFDNNGKVDMYLTYQLGTPMSKTMSQLTDAAIIVYSLDVPYNPGNMDWPMTNHDPQNTSVKLSNTATSDTITIKGYIKPDFKYKYPAKILVNFRVDVSGTDYTAVTDESGYFEIRNVPKNSKAYTLKISKKNYLSREISVDTNIQGNVIQLSTADKPMEIWAGEMQIDGVQDNAVNMRDIIALAALFNSAAGDGRYMEDTDLNKDGAINMLDIVIIAKHFGTTPSSYPKFK